MNVHFDIMDLAPLTDSQRMLNGELRRLRRSPSESRAGLIL